MRLFAVLAEAACSLSLSPGGRPGPRATSRDREPPPRPAKGERRGRLRDSCASGVHGRCPVGLQRTHWLLLPLSKLRLGEWSPLLRPRSADPLPPGGSSQTNGSGWKEREAGGDTQEGPRDYCALGSGHVGARPSYSDQTPWWRAPHTMACGSSVG